MNPEKEIINWWLNRNGFFTLSSINVGKNKDIDIIALKVTQNKKEFIHIESMVSISQAFSEENKDEMVKTVVEKKFNDKIVISKIQNLIKTHTGEENDYKKSIVLGMLAKSTKKEIIDKFNEKGIDVILFEDLLFEIIKNIKGHYYNNPVIRTIQLIKFIILADPNLLAELSSETLILNTTDRGKFINNLLKSEKAQNIIDKKFTEDDLIRLLNNSSLKQPERLARILEEQILSKRSRTRFLSALLKQDTIKEKIKEEITTIAKSQKGLGEFF